MTENTNEEQTVNGEAKDELAEVTTKPTASIYRDEDEVIKVGDNLSFEYLLKNGKTLRIDVKKPNLGISTKLGDMMMKRVTDEDGNSYIQANNVDTYEFLMNHVIKLVSTDTKPIHKVNFDTLSEIGVTKSELDDIMNIVATFHLQ